jgi:glyoxylase-like metal-dependent hydrolase (beta-lactamase superfamily II)
MSALELPPGVHVFERGWLSANNVLFDSPEGTALVDSGHHDHAAQTVALVDHRLGDRPLDLLLNTHLHSDHCGGNAALQARYPAMQTAIPPGLADAVRHWDPDTLSHRPTGQECDPFRADALLEPGQTIALGGQPWQILCAPGHDPHAVLLFQPAEGLLISGDALWENGFGVVFPELEGEPGFDEVAATLDLIEALSPRTVIPGHGAVFGGSATAVRQSIERARQRLAQFQGSPEKHRRYALKVLLKFRLLSWQRCRLERFHSWAAQTPYLRRQHGWHDGDQPYAGWVEGLLQDLVKAGAARLEGEWVLDA